MSKILSRRHFLQMSSAVAAVGVLAACAPAGQSPSGSTGGEGASADTIHLKWDTFRGPGTGWNEERIETFQQAHPNVTIEFRPLTGSSQQDNYGKMYSMFAAGDLGDIIAFDPSHYHFVRAINGNIIGTLDDLIASDNLDLTQWFEQFIVLQAYQGKQYGLPSWGWAGQDTFVINAVHFEQEGVELPDPVGHDTTMATYGEWVRKFYKDGERFGLGFTFAEGPLVPLCRAFGGDLIDAEGTKSLLLDSPESQEALRWLYALSVEEKVLPAQADFVAAQLEGKITMNWGGSLNVRNFKRDIKDETVAKAHQGLLPTDANGKFPSQIRGGTWNILKDSAHPQEAFQFIKHITDTEGCYSFNLVAGQGAFVRPDVLDRLIEQDPVHEWFIPNLENGIPAYAPANSRGREYTDACAQYLTLMMDPSQPLPFEQGLQGLHDSIQKVLDQEPAA
ncbi:MAG: extracellular solute-binding protein [Caldilineaceae bacterium]|nr:extracellular solute-binding protein [Caldilineaceae bacterium]